MSYEFCFECPLPNGLHARPAGELVDVTTRFASEITLINQQNNVSANAKSVLSLLGAEVSAGDRCCIRINGSDAEAALAALHRFVEQALPRLDESLSAEPADEGAVILPRVLRRMSVKFHTGAAVARGIARGSAVMVGGLALPPELSASPPVDVADEQAKISKAIATVRFAIEMKLAGHPPAVEAEVLRAHLGIIGDLSLRQKLMDLIAQGRSAGRAVVEAGEFFMNRLRAAQTIYIRERALDMQDICLQLLEQVYGSKFKPAGLDLDGPSIVIAENLTPRQFLSLDRQYLKGLVLRQAGATSHTVILARSFNVPTLAGVIDAHRDIAVGQEIILDGNLGILIAQVTPAIHRYYSREQEKMKRRRARLERYAHGDALTPEGRRVEVAANVATAQEAVAAFEQGAEGIGVFRTEMLFMERDSAPSEDEQFEVYAQAARAGAGRGVIIRTIDVGGDKPLPYLNLPREANPFLGYRGVRIYPDHQSLIDTQIRAILRASAFGSVRAMVPMIATVEEVQWMKARLTRIKADLATRNIAHDPAMPLGVMIEVPSVAFMIDQLAKEADFFSIGTNDLSQYFLAADRDSSSVSSLYSSRHPAFLRLLKQIIDESHRCGKWVGLCGEMGGDIKNLPLLLALGFDEISAAAAAIPAIKAGMAQLPAADCRALLQEAMSAAHLREVEAMLQEFRGRSAAGQLLDPELIMLDCDCDSKEEAIKQIVDAFYVAGRTDDPMQVEEAVWARESTYTTHIGHGIAIPHCKTDAIAANSIGVARLTKPISWGDDGQSVRMVILLAIRESDKDETHLKILANLARTLLQDDFRRHLMQATDAAALLQCLTEQLTPA